MSTLGIDPLPEVKIPRPPSGRLFANKSPYTEWEQAHGRGSLSGGGVGGKTPKDIFPNYFSGRVTLSAANTFTTVQERLPVQRFTVGRNKVTVMEFLWLELSVGSATDFAAAADFLEFAVTLGSEPTGMGDIDDGNVLARITCEMALATSGAIWVCFPKIHLWANAGQRGQPVATDIVHMSALSGGMGNPLPFSWRIYYRFIDINALEFNGLLQSQLQG